jgi:Putative transposase
MSLHVNEFLRRFLLHVLPPGFVRIRHFGFLSTRNRSQLLPVCFRLLEAASAQPLKQATSHAEQHTRPSWLCPRCNGPMLLIERFTALQLHLRAPPDLLPAAP